jgi:ferrous iron transport protein A
LNTTSNKSIAQLKRNETGKILRFTDQVLASRLVAMGILPGSQVQILGKAPLKSGLYLKFDNQRVALRVKEAQSIVVSV